MRSLGRPLDPTWKGVDPTSAAAVIPGPTWQLLVHLGGDAEEVAEVKALVMDLVNAVARCWEALPLPPHTGGGG